MIQVWGAKKTWRGISDRTAQGGLLCPMTRRTHTLADQHHDQVCLPDPAHYRILARRSIEVSKYGGLRKFARLTHH